MLLTQRLVLASINHAKAAELRELLASHPGLEVLRADQVVRNSEKFRAVVDWSRPCLEIAIAKARLLGRGCHDPVLSESACLELGPEGERMIVPDDDLDSCYSTSRWGDPVERVLGFLGGEPREAVLDSAVALLVEGVLLHAVERVHGTVVPQRRGAGGCGFDSIFIPERSRSTLAEMSFDERALRTPRAKAVGSVFRRFEEAGVILVRPQAG